MYHPHHTSSLTPAIDNSEKPPKKRKKNVRQSRQHASSLFESGTQHRALPSSPEHPALGARAQCEGRQPGSFERGNVWKAKYITKQKQRQKEGRKEGFLGVFFFLHTSGCEYKSMPAARVVHHSHVGRRRGEQLFGDAEPLRAP